MSRFQSMIELGNRNKGRQVVSKKECIEILNTFSKEVWKNNPFKFVKDSSQLSLLVPEVEEINNIYKNKSLEIQLTSQDGFKIDNIMFDEFITHCLHKTLQRAEGDMTDRNLAQLCYNSTVLSLNYDCVDKELKEKIKPYMDTALEINENINMIYKN